MKQAAVISQWLIRITGILQLLLGFAFWGGAALGMIPLHMMIGFVLVLALAVLAIIAMRAGVPIGLVIAALALVVITPWVGMGQLSWVVGQARWASEGIKLLHLLIGLGAIGLGEQLARGVKNSRKLAVQR